jgi:1-deoxy-D-xylulose-5-phosphate synthase
VTGDDGASHNGMWDITMLRLVPGLRIAAPRDGVRLAELFRECVGTEDGPTAIRYPKGAAPEPMEPVETVGGVDVLHRSGSQDVLIVSFGAVAGVALGAAALLAEQEVGATVVDPRWVAPLDPALVTLAARHRLVVTIEDSSRTGGAGTGLAQLLEDADVDVPVRTVGLPREFLDHGKPADVRAAAGINPTAVADTAMRALSKAKTLEGNVR